MNISLPIQIPEPNLLGVAVAIGVGLLIGIERERSSLKSPAGPAGIRTFTLLALMGALSSWIGMGAQLLVLLAALVLATVAYLREGPGELGLTTEVTIVVVTLLGMLSTIHPNWTASLGVVVAVLLAAKPVMHRFSREVLSGAEVRDGLILAAAALVVLPLLPAQGFGPDGLFNLRRLWQLLVMLLAVGMLGHVAQRLLGARFGLPLAGFFAGFASSTAAVAAFGRRARARDVALAPLVAAALLANLSSLTLFSLVVGSLNHDLLVAASLPLSAAALALLLGAGQSLLMARMRRPAVATAGNDGGTAAAAPAAANNSVHTAAFGLGHALLLALAISLVLVIANLAQRWFGETGALATAVIAAFAELHAAAATVSQLSQAGTLSVEHARVGLIVLLAAGAVSKTVLAFVSGGSRYALLLGGGLLAMLLAAGAALLI